MKFEPQCKKRSDLYREWAMVLDMCEAAGISTYGTWKFDGIVQANKPILSLAKLEEYEFAIAIVEGKPVFRGDKVYDTTTGVEFIAGEHPSSMYRATWNPPRRTITINGEELPAPDGGNFTMNIIFHGWKRSEDRDAAQAAILRALDGIATLLR